MSDNYIDVKEYNVGVEEYKSDNVVKTYKESNKLEFPLLLLSGTSMEAFRVKTLKNILGYESLIDTESYHVYVFFNGNMIKVGKLANEKLRTVLNEKVFSTFKKQVMLDNDTIIEGDLLYALCTSSAVEL